MSSQSLRWNGDALTAKMRAAQINGVNKTMADAVQQAKNNHTWNNQTGVLEGSIKIAEFARADAAGVAGTWGSTDVEYARIHELGGVIEHPGGTPYFIREDGMAVFVRKDDPRAADLPKTKPHQIVMPARPYLRPAADKHYPELAANIKKEFEGSGAKSGGTSKPSQGGTSDG